MSVNVVVVSECSEKRLVEFGIEIESRQTEDKWEFGKVAHAYVDENKYGTDADFAEKVGSQQQRVNECRRIFATRTDYRSSGKITWTHLRVSLAWDDWQECLDWAAATEASVAEMRAWRRAKNGENIREEAVSLDETTVTAESPVKPVASPGLQRGPASAAQITAQVKQSQAELAQTDEPKPLPKTNTKYSEATQKKSEDEKPKTQPVAEPGNADEPASLLDEISRRLQSIEVTQLASWHHSEYRRLKHADIRIPESVDFPEVHDAVDFWCEYLERRAIGKDIPPNSPQLEALWRMLASWNVPATAICAAIDKAVSSTWDNLQRPEEVAPVTKTAFD